MYDDILKAYSLVHESKQADMTAGNTKPGDLEGPAKGVIKNSGPKEVDGAEEAEEAPDSLSPVKKKKIKENNDMITFDDLYSKVLSEQDIESSEYNDEMGDFPPSADEDSADMEDMGHDEEAEADTFSQLADLFSQAAELFRKMSGAEADEAELDMEEPSMEPGLGEAVSEPEPKEFKGNTSSLQAPTKLGVSGVKASSKKASATGTSKSRTGELESAPTGVTPGKSPMKVGGSGAASSGKNASMLEN